ncbi:hypothetical protein N8791_04470 [Gammaproteobacteria bacterium]|jgi:hypothetical protein|nr:hypothetical protein [Gammaproteobacteria bacterium]|tara:strand:- start:466 stop:630 length:165 start_codon:yes stop_codon:yes gene_type:complete
MSHKTKDIIITFLIIILIAETNRLEWGLHPSWLIIIIPAWIWYLWGAYKDKFLK